MPEEQSSHYWGSFDDPVQLPYQALLLIHGFLQPYKLHICKLTCLQTKSSNSKLVWNYWNQGSAFKIQCIYEAWILQKWFLTSSSYISDMAHTLPILLDSQISIQVFLFSHRLIFCWMHWYGKNNKQVWAQSTIFRTLHQFKWTPQCITKALCSSKIRKRKIRL